MQTRLVTPLLLLTLILGACNLPYPATVTSPGVEPETLAPNSGNCYYVWATQELPEASEKFNRAIQSIFPEADGSAYAYGEDCVYADGRRTFGAMETDLRIAIPLKDLKDDEAVSLYVEKLLAVLGDFPTDSLPAHIKLIEFRFFLKPTDESRYLRFDLQVGLDALAKGLHGQELLKALEAAPR